MFVCCYDLSTFPESVVKVKLWIVEKGFSLTTHTSLPSLNSAFYVKVIGIEESNYAVA